jgi:hypothetical protein
MRRSIGARIHFLLGVACVLAAISQGASAQERPPVASDHQPPPTGLVVVIANTPDRSVDLASLDNPSISGVAFQIHWSDIEAKEGSQDWSTLDRLFDAADSAKKWVHLLIFPGFFSPPWALEGVQTESFPLQYGPGKGAPTSLPMPWDQTYLRRWLDFMKRVSQRYGTRPAFRMMAAAGPTSVSVECTLPKTPADLKKWQQLGYKPSKYIGAWKQVFEAYAASFPNQYISLSAGAGQINIDEQGEIEHRAGNLQTRQAIVDAGQAALGRQFVLQMSDVHAGPGPNGSNSEAEDQFLMAYNGKIITGLQMGTNAERNSGFMGDEGHPALALKKSIDLALEPNSSGQRVNYLEIHETDVVADDMQADLAAAASSFGSEERKEPKKPKT